MSEELILQLEADFAVSTLVLDVLNQPRFIAVLGEEPKGSWFAFHHTKSRFWPVTCRSKLLERMLKLNSLGIHLYFLCLKKTNTLCVQFSVSQDVDLRSHSYIKVTGKLSRIQAGRKRLWGSTIGNFLLAIVKMWVWNVSQREGKWKIQGNLIKCLCVIFVVTWKAQILFCWVCYSIKLMKVL